MNEQVLANIYGFLKGEELVTNEFNDWKNNFSVNDEVQTNIYNHLQQKSLVTSNFAEWQNNILNTESEGPLVNSQQNVITDTGDGYHYKQEMDVSGQEVYYTKKEDAEEWVKSSGSAKNAIASKIFNKEVEEQEEYIDDKSKKETEQERLLRIEEEKVGQEKKAKEKADQLAKDNLPPINREDIARNDTKIASDLNVRFKQFGFTFSTKKKAGEFVFIKSLKTGEEQRFAVNKMQRKNNIRIADDMYSWMKERAVDAGGSYVDVALKDFTIPEADVNKQVEEAKNQSKLNKQREKDVSNMSLQEKLDKLYPKGDIPKDFIDPRTQPGNPKHDAVWLFGEDENTKVYNQKVDQAKKILALNEIAEKEGIDLDNITDIEYGQLMQRQDLIDLANSYPDEITEDSTDDEINKHKKVESFVKKEMSHHIRSNELEKKIREQVKRELKFKDQAVVETEVKEKTVKLERDIHVLVKESETSGNELEKITKKILSEEKYLTTQGKEIKKEIKDFENKTFKNEEERLTEAKRINKKRRNYNTRYEDYLKLSDEGKAVHSAYTKLNDKHADLKLDDQVLKIYAEQLGKDHRIGTKVKASFANAAIDMAQNLELYAGTLAYTVNPLGFLADRLLDEGVIKDEGIKTAIITAKYTNPVLSKVSVLPGSSVDISRNKINAAIDGYQKRKLIDPVGHITTFDEIKDLGDFGEWSANMFAAQIPNLALMWATGGASLWIMGASSAGAQYDKMMKEKRLYERYGGLYGTDHSFEKMFTISTLSGAAEALSEKITLGQVQAFKGTLKDIGVKRAFGNAIKRSFWSTKNLKYFGKQIFEEGFSEGVATISQNYLDILGSKDKDFSKVFEGVDEAFVSGVVMSTFLQAPMMFNKIKDSFAHPDTNQKIGENSKRIEKLQDTLIKQQISKENTTAIEAEIAELVAENTNLLETDIKRLDLLDKNEKKELLKIESDNFKLRKRVEEINQDSGYTTQQKKDEIKKLQEKFNNNQTIKQEILDKYPPNVVNEKYDEFTQTVNKNIKQAKKIGINIDLKNGSNADAEIFLNENGASQIEVDGEIHDTNSYIPAVIEGLDQIIKDPKADPRDIKEAKNLRKGWKKLLKNQNNIIQGESKNFGAIIPSEKGFNIFVNKQAISEKGKGESTAFHEFLHAVLFSTLNRDVNTQMAFGAAAISELNNGIKSGYITINPDSNINERINSYKPEEGKGEEVLTIMSEAIINGDITFKGNMLMRLADVIRRTLQGLGLKDIKFDNSTDVFNFLRDYSKTMKDGKVIDKSIQKMMKQGASGRIVEQAVRGERADQLAFAKDQSSQLQKKLDAVGGDKIALMTDMLDTGKDFEKSKFAKEIGGITESITQRLFDPLAIKAPDSLDVIPGSLKVDGAKVVGTKRDAYKKALVEKAAELVIREYEVGTQPLDKFVSTRLALRANALATELGVPQEFTTKIDNISESEIQDFNEQQDKEREDFEKQDIRAQMLAEARGEKTPDGLPLVLNTIGKTELISKVNNIVKKAKLNLADIKSIKDVKALVIKKGGPLNGILDLVASEFGVESSRIINNKDLNADQRDSAREFINSKADAFNKMLIKGDTADGKATGAANTALGPAFYIKGDRVAAKQTGSTQGKKTQVLNPNITTDSFKKAFEGKGTTKDSIIKALITQVTTVVANQAIRKTAPKSVPASVVTKIGDGMSSAYFSKTIDKKLKNNKPSEIAKGLFIVETLKANAKNITPENVKQEIQAMFADALNAEADVIITQKELDNIIQDVETVSKIITKKKIKSDVVDLQGGTIGDFIVSETIEAAETFKELRSGRKIQTRRTGQTEFKSMSDPKFAGKVRVGHNLIAREMNEVYPGFGEVFLTQGLSRSAKVHKGGIVFTSLTKYKKGGKVGQARGGYANNTTDARFISDAKKGGRGNFKDTALAPGGLQYKDFNKVKDNLDNIIESQKQDNQALRLVADKMKESYDAGKIDADVVRTIIQGMNANQSGLIKRAAIIGWLPLGKWSGKATYEHMIPSSKIADAMLDYVLSGKDTTAKNYFTKLMDAYKATYLPSKQDNFINKFYRNTMPLWWDVVLPPILRYFNLYTVDGMGDIQFQHVDSGQIIGTEIIADKKAFNKLIKNNKDILGDFNNDAFMPHVIVEGAKIIRNTFYNSKSINEDGKGASVWDFDDTIAESKSKVLWTAPDGTTGSLTAEQFADKGSALLQQDYKFDFSEFSKVVKGEKGPFFKKFADRIKKFGVKDNFILTARPIESAPAIKEFLKSQGINIPLKNITALANSTSEAKALWIADNMISKGYNNIYFADDALQNVQAVKNMMEQFDVKFKVQQSKVQFSKDGPAKIDEILMDGEVDIDSDFNAIIDEKLKGKSKKNKFKFFIPPSAEDFEGLLYPLLGKGKKGEKHHKFFKEKLFDPFAKGIRALNIISQEVGNDVKKIKKKMPGIAKILKKAVPGTMYTLDDAARVYLWDKAGYDIPFLSKGDKAKLIKAVKNNPIVQTYAENMNQVADKLKGYPEPGNNWLAGNINFDMSQLARKSRDVFLKEWKENVDVIFSDANLRKLERLLGTNYVESLKDVLHRMNTGSNRSLSKYKFVNDFMDWINGSIATTMFVNMRSALLQTLSTVNFINWHDNNMLAAGKAFANLPQFCTDFTMIFNSDFLKQRRGGLQMDLNANEMIKSIQDSKSPIRATIGWILKQGFKPTQIMDSFAIAAGGATMYRNRINTYLKQGLNQKEAATKAFNDMMEIAESTQQSSRPDRISAQQASPLGKLILAFQNTPMQYMRLTKKAALDLANGRGDAKTNISKIIYYAGVQNIIFYSMQQALFALAFGDDEDEDEEKMKKFADKKKTRVINGMLDSILRGTGIAGAVVSTVKNAIMTYMEQNKKWKPDHGYTMIELLNLSPPIGIKARKIYSGAIKNYEWNEDVIKHMSKTDIDNPIYKSLFSVVEATTNIPLARAQSKLKNIREAFDANNKNWQRIALFMGWSTWDLGIQDDEIADIKDEITEIKKLERKEKREKEKAEKEKQLEQEFEKEQKEEKKEGKKEITCIAVNKDGKRCGLKVVGDGKYCTVHQKTEKRNDGKEVQCKKIKSDGKRCKMQTTNKSSLCYYHD